MISIASWNVNSLRVRLGQLLTWLAEQQPDVVALQETKIPDRLFPTETFQAAGYAASFTGEKTYNGVAILSKAPAELLHSALPHWDDSQRRLLVVRLGQLLVINVYVPNGAAVGSEKYAYKLEWLRRLTDYVAALGPDPPLRLILGDFNIAPEDRDVYDPRAWGDAVLVSEPERDALRQLQTLNYVDVFRCFEQPEGCYSWWDYRGGSFRRNHGLRIDLLLANTLLAQNCRACSIDVTARRAQPASDHAPVIARFDLDQRALFER